MKYLLTFFGFILVAMLGVLYWASTHQGWGLMRASNDYFTGFATILAAIIAVVGVYLTIKHNNEIKKKELLDNLDSKSEWRKNLYDVASKTYLDTDDVYRVLASLRYFPHKNKGLSDERYFREATQIIFSDLYTLIEEYKTKIEEKAKEKDVSEIKAPILTFEQSEMVRIYTKYLLKHHWEYNKDKLSFIPDEEGKVWRKTKSLILHINNIDTYFKDVTQFSYFKKNNNRLFHFIIIFSTKFCRWMIRKAKK